MGEWHMWGVALSIKWICVGGPDMVGNGGDLLNVLEANCSSKYFLSCDMFSGVAENGNFVDRGGGVRSTDRLVLTCVMFSLPFD